MPGFEAAFDEIRKLPWRTPDPALMSLEPYVVKGGDANRKSILKCQTPQSHYNSGAGELARRIARPVQAVEADLRALEGLLISGFDEAVGAWANRSLEAEAKSEDTHGVLVQALRAAGREAEHVDFLGLHLRAWSRGAAATSAGNALLSLSDADLLRLAHAAAQLNPLELAAFLLRKAPERVGVVLPALLGANSWRIPEVCALLVEQSGRVHESAIQCALSRATQAARRFEIARVLHAMDPGMYRDAAVKEALTCRSDAAMWLLQVLGPAAIPHLLPIVESPGNNAWARRWDCERILTAARALGTEALPLCKAAAQSADEEIAFLGLTHLAALTQPATAAFVQERVARGLEHKDAAYIARFAELAGRSGPGPHASALWGLVGHASRPVRAAATRALARLGEAGRAKALELLADRKRDNRHAAVSVLAAIGGAEKALESRLELESSDDVRDAMIATLDRAWSAAGRETTRADVEVRIARSLPRIKRPPASWAEAARFNCPRLADGSDLGEAGVAYLFFRQARSLEMCADPEARALYRMIDRSSSGDFAMAVLEAFLRSGAKSADRWALALAALLGDGRTVRKLVLLASEWADTARNVLGVAAVQALALQGSDEALLSLDSLATRYRSRRRIVSDSAREAFVQAAETMGVSPDELGDRVVPWLGFAPGKARTFIAGDRTLQAVVSAGFKLRFRDGDSGKWREDPPKGSPAETKKELKELAAAVREARKSQTVRMEQLFVRQRRWPGTRWKELFLEHPLLLPFAVRHVWGVFAGDGRLMSTFRALEDRSLTDSGDSAVTIPPASTVGLVHPLDLDHESRCAWLGHMADHEVEPLFPQLDRPVARPAASVAAGHDVGVVAGKSVVGIAFRSRMERLGWRRGATLDGGCVSWYVKPFPASGVDGVLHVEGMYMGIGADESVTLGLVQFLSSGSEVPAGPLDERFLPLGSVPPLVYSETISDLPKIAGEAIEVAEE